MRLDQKREFVWSFVLLPTILHSHNILCRCSCFLVTYYFSQKILTQYSSCPSLDDRKAVDVEVEAFLRKYGAYLQIHSCLVLSAKVEADKAIDQLLELARFDPLHREATKELARANDLTFYDTVSQI